MMSYLGTAGVANAGRIESNWPAGLMTNGEETYLGSDKLEGNRRCDRWQSTGVRKQVGQ